MWVKWLLLKLYVYNMTIKFTKGENNLEQYKS